jgi:iron complex outermembrane receptor protein
LKKGLGLILTGLILSANVFAKEENIESLLEELKEQSELSKKTRDESLGYLYVFTRDDLERMQAHTLIDVIKSLRMQNLIISQFGQNATVVSGDYPSFANYVKLYINDQDVSSIDTNSPFFMFNNFPLDHIDHIEVYYLGSSVRLADEPAFMVIKLYTKLPERENTNFVKGSVSSTKGYGFSFFDARELNNDLSYLVYFNRSNINNKSRELNNQHINNDSLENYLYLNVKYKGTRFELSGLHKNFYNFVGYSFDGAPDKGKIKANQVYFIVSRDFLEDKSLKLKFSIAYDQWDYYEKNSPLQGGIMSFNSDMSNPAIEGKGEVEFLKTYASISKVFNTKNNSLFIVSTLKSKDYSNFNLKYKYLLGNEFDLANIFKYHKENIFTFAVENQFNINQSNLILAGIRYDAIKRDGGKKDFYPITAKLGYIYVPKKNITFKTFLSNNIITPSFFQELGAKEDLDYEKYLLYSFEFSYTKDKHKISILAGWNKIKDKIAPENGLLVNLKNSYEASSISLDYTYKFNKKDKIVFNYWKTFNIDITGTPVEGGVVRLFKNFEKTYFYSELLYRKGYEIFGTKVGDSYDLTMAVSYDLDESTKISFKGQNLLNNSIKTVFYIPLSMEIKPLRTIDRKYIFSITKYF